MKMHLLPPTVVRGSQYEDVSPNPDGHPRAYLIPRRGVVSKVATRSTGLAWRSSRKAARVGVQPVARSASPAPINRLKLSRSEHGLRCRLATQSFERLPARAQRIAGANRIRHQLASASPVPFATAAICLFEFGH